MHILNKILADFLLHEKCCNMLCGRNKDPQMVLALWDLEPQENTLAITLFLGVNPTLLCFLCDTFTGLWKLPHIYFACCHLIVLLISSAREKFKAEFHDVLFSVSVHKFQQRLFILAVSGSWYHFQLFHFSAEPASLCPPRNSASRFEPQLHSFLWDAEVPIQLVSVLLKEVWAPPLREPPPNLQFKNTCLGAQVT